MISRKLSLNEIFQQMDDFELCDGICGAAEEHYGYDFLIMWPEAVPLQHKLVHFVWSTTGFLQCEGFARYLNLKCHHAAYPECFDILGLSPLAAEIRKSLKLFPKSDLGDTDALISHFGSWGKIEEIVDSTESQLYANSDAIEAALASYVRNHKCEFESLLTDIRKQRAYKKLVGEITD